MIRFKTVLTAIALCFLALGLEDGSVRAQDQNTGAVELPVHLRMQRGFYWMTDQQVLIVDTNESKDEQPVKPNCHLFLLEILTGRRVPIISIARRKSWYPWLPSPDGKRVLYNDSLGNDQDRQVWVVAELDGSKRMQRPRAWPPEEVGIKHTALRGPGPYDWPSPIWLSDSRHWADIIPSRLATGDYAYEVRIYDRLAPGVEKRIPLRNSPFYNWVGTSKVDQAVLWNYRELTLVDWVSPRVSQRNIPIPRLKDIYLQDARITPRGDYVVWAGTTRLEPKGKPLLPKVTSKPTSPGTQREWLVLYVSRLDGSALRRIGYTEWIWYEDTFPRAEWTPNGKRVVFWLDGKYYWIRVLP